jgi:hypothetical protein
VEEEITNDHKVWVHQERAVISAQSHDIWNFTPEFLANEVCEEEWRCRRVTRTGDAVEIEHGPAHWRMTADELWITADPDCVIRGHNTGSLYEPLTPILAHNFLNAAPYTPVRYMWLFWQISAIRPSSQEWMMENFLPNGSHAELGSVRLQPRLSFFAENRITQVTVRNDPVRRDSETFDNAVIFECFVSRGGEQTMDEMILNTQRWEEHLAMAEMAINHLLMEGSPQ